MKRIVFTILLFFCLVSPAFAAPTYYYVDNSVGSSGNGTSGSPWKNLSDINWTTISEAAKPCTIYISGGATSQTYSEQLSIQVSGSSSTWPYVGTPAGEIIIKRPSAAEWAGHSGIVYIRTTSENAIIFGASDNYVSNIIIDGLDVSASAECGIGAWSPTYIVLRNSVVKNCGGRGFCPISANYVTIQNNDLGPQLSTIGDDQISPNGDHWVVENNIIHSMPSTGGPHQDGLHFGSACEDYHIRYNIFRVNYVAYAVYLETAAGGPLTNIRIYGNVFETYLANGEDYYPAISLDCDLGGDNDYSTAYIYNNTFINMSFNGGMAIQEVPACNKAGQRLYIENNIFYNAVLDLEGTITVLDYNLYYFNTLTDHIVELPTQYATLAALRAAQPTYEAHGQEGNPNLQSVNNSAGVHDPRLTASSALAIGTGDATLGAAYGNGLADSFNETGWPASVSLTARGVAWDIGAWERTTEYTLSLTISGTGSGTVSSSPAGINSSVSTTYDFDDSTVVTLTATAAGGSTFLEWSGTGGCTGSSTCELTMSAAKAATATFNITGGGTGIGAAAVGTTGSMVMGSGGSITIVP